MVAEHISADPPMPLTFSEIKELAELFSVRIDQIIETVHPLDSDRRLIQVKVECGLNKRLVAVSSLNKGLYRVPEYRGHSQNFYAFADYWEGGVPTICLTVPYDRRFFLTRLKQLIDESNELRGFFQNRETKLAPIKRDIADLPDDHRTAIIRENTKKIMEESSRAADEIVALGTQNFAKEYRQIKSERMRMAVLSDLYDETGLGVYQPDERLKQQENLAQSPLRRTIMRLLKFSFAGGSGAP